MGVQGGPPLYIHGGYRHTCSTGVLGVRWCNTLSQGGVPRGVPLSIYRGGPPLYIYMGGGGGSPSIYIYGGVPLSIYTWGVRGVPPRYIYIGGTVIPVVLEYWGYDGVIHQSRGVPPWGEVVSGEWPGTYTQLHHCYHGICTSGHLRMYHSALMHMTISTMQGDTNWCHLAW